MNIETLKVVIGTGSGVLIGGFVGFVVTRRVLKTKYEVVLDEEVARIKAFYQSKRKDDILEEEEPDHTYRWEGSSDASESVLESEYDPQEIENMSEEELEIHRDLLQQDLVSKGRNSKIVQKMGYSEVVKKTDEAPIESVARLTEAEMEQIDPNDELLQSMIADRTSDDPYVITIDEFMEDNDHEKISITYFDGDGNLCDSQDRIIPDIGTTIGHDSLTKFGVFSKDNNVVYVRNEKVSIDFEVVLDERSYTEVIAGFRDPKVLKKMREDD